MLLLLTVPDYFERIHGLPALVSLLVDVALVVNENLEPLRQRIDDRSADAVQAAGDLVAASAELAARVQDREDDLNRGNARLMVDPDRDAAAVVGHGDGPVPVQRHLNMVAGSGQSLVHRVVHDFIDEVMETPKRGRTDIHAGALPDCFKTLQDLNGIAAVFLVYFIHMKLLNAHSIPPRTTWNTLSA